MAGKKDRLLTNIAKRTIDEIQNRTDLNAKQIMSASILAFNDLSFDQQVLYVSKSLMGDELRQHLGPESERSAGAAKVVDDAVNAAAAPTKKRGHRTG